MKRRTKILITTMATLSIVSSFGLINNKISHFTNHNLVTNVQGANTGFKIPSDATSSGTIGTSPYYIEGTTLYVGSGSINAQALHDVIINAGNITKIDGSLATNLTSDYGLFSKFKIGEWKTQDLITSINLPNYKLPANSSNGFAGFSNLTYLNTENWDTSDVTDMSYLFDNDSKLTTLDVSKWNTSKVTNMNSIFQGTSKLTSLDVSNWNTSKVTDMSYLFSDATSLKSLDLSKWNTSNVTNMRYLFNDSTSLTSLDLSNWNTSNVTNMNAMFQSTLALKTLNISNFNTSKVTNMAGMFSMMYHITSLDVSKLDTSNVTNMMSMFYNLPVSSLDVSHFNTSKVTNMTRMFNGASALTSLDVSNFDTSKVTNMSDLFNNAGASSLKTLDVSKWNTSNVTNMSGMFTGVSVPSLDVSKFNTSNVTNMTNMFSHNPELTSLDVSNFDTSKVTSMGNMFHSDSALTSLNLSNFTLNDKTTATDFVSGMTNLNKLILGKNVYLSNSNFTGVSSPWLEQESKTKYNTINDVFAESRTETKTYIHPVDPSVTYNTGADFGTHELDGDDMMTFSAENHFSFNLGSYDSIKLSINVSELIGNKTNQKLSGTAYVEVLPVMPAHEPVTMGPDSYLNIGTFGKNENNTILTNKMTLRITNAKYADTYRGTINYSIAVTP